MAKSDVKVISSDINFLSNIGVYIIISIAAASSSIAIAIASSEPNGPPLWFASAPVIFAGIVLLIWRYPRFNFADRIEDHGDFLIACIGKKRCEIPLLNIASIEVISAGRIIMGCYIVLKLLHENDFGKKIKFYPPVLSALFALSPSNNKVAEDLENRIRALQHKSVVNRPKNRYL